MDQNSQQNVGGLTQNSVADGIFASQQTVDLQTPSVHLNENESNNLDLLKEESTDPESVLQKYPTCKGDVELLDTALSAWRDQNSGNELMKKEIKQLKELNEITKKRTEEHISDLEKTIELMQKDVDIFHGQLNLTDELNKDLKDMKLKYAELEAKLQAKSDECLRMQEEHVVTINSLKDLHLKQTEESDKENERKFKTLENEYKLKTDKLAEEIEHLNEKVIKIEKEKQSEISVLQMEYESKVAKLQLKKAAVPQQPQSSVLNQDIYRKKLHHLKLEYEQENAGLKHQIRCLQQQLSQKSFGRKSSTFSNK